MIESCSHIDRKQNMLFIILPLLATEGALGCNQIALPVTTTTSRPSTTTTTPAPTIEIGLL